MIKWHTIRDRFIFVMVGLCLVVAAIAGIRANSSFRRPTNYQILVVIPDHDSDQWANFKIGLRNIAKSRHLRLEMVKSMDDHPKNQPDLIISTKPLSTKIPQILIDHQQLISMDQTLSGKTLALNLLKTGAKRIGVIQKEVNQNTQQRAKGIKDEIKQFSWWLKGDQASLENLYQASEVDAILCLDYESTELAIDAQKTNLFAYGRTNKCLYYTDTGVVTTLLYDDAYAQGYETGKQAYNLLEHGQALKKKTINYVLIKRANLFTDKNQNLLFPTHQ